MSAKVTGLAVRYWLVVAGLFLSWIGISRALVPWVIRRAYSGESLDFLNRLISGQAEHPVERYLGHWAGIAQWLTILFALLAVLLFVAIVKRVRERVRAWRRTVHDREDETRANPVRLRPVEYVLIAAWLGMLAGFLESVYATWRYVSGRWMPVHTHLTGSVDVFWMPAVAATVLFAAAGLALCLIARARRSGLTLRVAGSLLGFLFFFALLRSTAHRVEWWAAILLAAGLAHQAGRYSAIYASGFRRLVRRFGIAILVIIVGASLGLRAWQGWSERRGLSSLPSAREGAPNVLLLVLDTVRAWNLSLYGYQRPTTPTLERFAATGVTFDRAVAPSPWTLPSHATMFTGRPHHELSVDWNRRLDDEHPTLAEVLASNGYATAGFVANFFFCGLRHGLNRGFLHYDAEPLNLSTVVASSWLTRATWTLIKRLIGNHAPPVIKRAAKVNAEFLAWMSGQSAERPWFAFLNYIDAHDPYLPPDPYNRRFAEAGDLYWRRTGNDRYTEEEFGQLEAAYDGALAYMDRQIELLFDELDRRGTLDNTLVIVTSDHGEQFGEHGIGFHANSLYLPVLHVPLIFRYPGAIPPTVRVREAVTLQDIPATIVDLLAIEDSSLPGRSMATFWGADEEERGEGATAVLSEVTQNPRIDESMPAARGAMASVVVGSLHYIRNGDGTEEVYDVEVDPEETTDLLTEASGSANLEELRAALQAALRPTSAVRRSPDADGGGGRPR